jgi:hypothetical protein
MTFILQEYDGPPRPRTAVAMIRTDDQGPMLVTVDGKAVRVAGALESGNKLQVEVLPGPHEFDVQVREVETGLVHEVPVRFIAEANKTYRLEVRAFQAPGGPTFQSIAYEVDPASDARLGPAAPAAAPPPAPPPPSPAPPAAAAPAPVAPPSAAAPAVVPPGDTSPPADASPPVAR